MDDIKVIIVFVTVIFTLLISLIPIISYDIANGKPFGVSADGFRFMDVVEENKKFLPATNLCGTRIAGGQITKSDSVPYQISLRYFLTEKWRTFCGGSLVTYLYVLTAAHCLYNHQGQLSRNIDIIRLVAGADKTDITELQFSKLQSKKIRRYWKHPKYEAYIHDIALIEADSNFKQATRVKPVRLKTPDITLTSTYCLVSGFGFIKLVPSKHLRMVCLHVVPIQECSKNYPVYKQFYDTYVCAGGGGKDAGAGDSGGPLVCSGYQVGIVAYGVQDAEDPGIYTNVEYYMKPNFMLLS